MKCVVLKVEVLATLRCRWSDSEVSLFEIREVSANEIQKDLRPYNYHIDRQPCKVCHYGRSYKTFCKNIRCVSKRVIKSHRLIDPTWSFTSSSEPHLAGWIKTSSPDPPCSDLPGWSTGRSPATLQSHRSSGTQLRWPEHSELRSAELAANSVLPLQALVPIDCRNAANLAEDMAALNLGGG